MWFTDRAVGRSSYSRLAQCVSVHHLVAMVIMELEGTLVAMVRGGSGCTTSMNKGTSLDIPTPTLSMHSAPTPAPMRAVKTCSVQGGLS